MLGEPIVATRRPLASGGVKRIVHVAKYSDGCLRPRWRVRRLAADRVNDLLLDRRVSDVSKDELVKRVVVAPMVDQAL